MENEQFSALTELLNFCRRALRSEEIEVKAWRRLRGRVNKAFGTAGPPRIKADYSLISDLKRGVPVSVVAKNNGMSRGTVYRIIKDHPELAQTWGEKRKKKQPDPAPAPVPDPVPVQPTEPPLPDVLHQFLASHMPKVASLPFPVEVKRTALGTLLSRLGLVQEDEFDALTDEELVARVTAYQGKGESQSDEARRDAAEAVADDVGFWVAVGEVTDSLTREEAAKLLTDEITHNLEPFTDVDVGHPLFAELKSHIVAVLSNWSRISISDGDIPEIARRAVRRIKDKATLPREVLEFAAIATSPAEPAIQSPGNGGQGEVGG